MANIFEINRSDNKITLGTADTSIYLTPMTQGSLLFAGANGLVSQDNTNLFWDNTNKYLGVGVFPDARTHIKIATASDVGLKIQGAASQEGDLLQIKDSDDNKLGYFDNIGRLIIGQTVGASNALLEVDNSPAVYGGAYYPLALRSDGAYFDLIRSSSNNVATRFAAVGDGVSWHHLGLYIQGSADDVINLRLRGRASQTADFFQITDSGLDPKIVIDKDYNVGIGVADPHSKLEVNGAISSATLTVTEANDATIAVGGVNYIFIDSTTGVGDPLVIDDFTGGVAGQVLHIVIRDNTAAVTIIDGSGSNQQIFLHDTGSNLVIAAAARGGATLICDGTHWYNVSHAKHV